MDDSTQEVVREVGFWKQAIAWAWAPVGALLGAFWVWLNKQLENRRIGEIALHKKLEEHMKDDTERFERLMKQMGDNHAEVLGHIIDLKGK